MYTSRWLAVLVAVCPVLGAAEERDAAAPAAATVEIPASKTTTTIGRTLSSQRALNGHVFIPSRYVLSPFSQTSFGMGVVSGFANATGPKFSLSGPDAGQVIGEQDYSYALLALGFEFDAKLAEWLGVRLAGAGSVFTGIDGKSVLVVGASGSVGVNAGLTAGMPIGDKTRVAATFDVEYAPSLDITVAAGIIQALETNDVSSSDYFNDQNIFTFVPGVAAAWAPTPSLGFTPDLGYVRPEKNRDDVTTSRNGVRLGLLVDFDVRGVQPQLPMGFVAGYSGDLPLGGEGLSRVQQFFGGVAYTGREDLYLGVEVGYRKFTLRDIPEGGAATSSLDSDGVAVTIAMRYYW
jgi:hypothetical protein